VSAPKTSAAGPLRVELGARSYDILVGAGLLGEAGALMAPLLPSPRVAIVTDETVARLHLATLEASLTRARIGHESIAFAPGEATKEFGALAALLDALLEAKVERSTTILALGGGVVGDLAGFAASIALRGLPFIQLPTTLLAQVDSAVGGKTGINTRQGKNLVGSFYQPRLVLADIATLATLPRRELLAGYAEVVKYGLIRDADFFAWLEANGERLIAGDESLRRQAVLKSCAIKAAIVAADERESGERALLNLGHTFGHALEAETGFGPELLHGEAVALGMIMAFDLSVLLGLCPPEDAARARRHLAAMGLPTDLAHLPGRRFDPAALLDHMSRDKKVRDGKMIFVLARGIGRGIVADAVEPAQLRALLDRAVAA
jgi:3-dehydroquinate synthase